MDRRLGRRVVAAPGASARHCRRSAQLREGAWSRHRDTALERTLLRRESAAVIPVAVAGRSLIGVKRLASGELDAALRDVDIIVDLSRGPVVRAHGPQVVVTVLHGATKATSPTVLVRELLAGRRTVITTVVARDAAGRSVAAAEARTALIRRSATASRSAVARKFPALLLRVVDSVMHRDIPSTTTLGADEPVRNPTMAVGAAKLAVAAIRSFIAAQRRSPIRGGVGQPKPIRLTDRIADADAFGRPSARPLPGRSFPGPSRQSDVRIRRRLLPIDRLRDDRRLRASGARRDLSNGSGSRHASVVPLRLSRGGTRRLADDSGDGRRKPLDPVSRIVVSGRVDRRHRPSRGRKCLRSDHYFPGRQVLAVLYPGHQHLLPRQTNSSWRSPTGSGAPIPTTR